MPDTELHIKIEASGDSHDALVEAIEFALASAKQGNLCGFDKNENGFYQFDINEFPSSKDVKD